MPRTPRTPAVPGPVAAPDAQDRPLVGASRPAVPGRVPALPRSPLPVPGSGSVSGAPAGAAGAAVARRTRGGVLVGALNRDWDRLLADPASAAACASWGRREPVLAALSGLSEVPGLVLADGDAVLLALLRCEQAGLPLAGRTVLQLMLPKAVRIAASQAGADGREEAVAAAVAALWQAVACYPTERRPVRVAANLAMETLAGTRRELTAARRQREATELVGLAAERLAAPASEASPQPCDLELHEALVRAVRQQVIDLGEARLLARVYAVAADGRPLDVRAVAAEEGLSWPALRARCSRSTRRLAAARARLAA